MRLLGAILVAALLALGAAGCGDDEATNENFEAITEPTGTASDPENYGYPESEPRKNKEGELLPPPVQIYGADKSGKVVDKDTVVIVKSQKQFEKLQKQIFKGMEERPLPSTDFKTRQMIVVFLKPKKDGASAQVTIVRKRKDGFTVETLRLLPGKGCPNVGDDTQPYSIVETDKLPGDPKLVVENQDRPPC